MYWKFENNILKLTDEITEYPSNNYSDTASEINDLIILIHLIMYLYILIMYYYLIIYMIINH